MRDILQVCLLLAAFVMHGCDGGGDSKYSLPKILINTNGKAIVDEPKVNAKIKILKNNSELFEGNIGIEIRGASAQLFPKKSYGFETRDKNNEDIDVSLFGYPKEEDWILYAPYGDKSLLRNMLIYELSRDIGMYASRTILVELTVNDVYQGVYVFMEKLKQNSGRINISKLKSHTNLGEDLTGGYILKLDNTAGNNLGERTNELNSFLSNHRPLHSSFDQKIHFLYDYPKAHKITTEQKNYISSYIANFENALANNDNVDKSLNYSATIDVPSFIDYFLLNELANNVDAYRVSTYMHKDKNEKLKMGPIWDFNLAFGNVNYCGGENTDTWAYQFNKRCPHHRLQVPFWWEKLLQDPSFTSQLKERWIKLREKEFSEKSILDKIDYQTNYLEKSGAINRNFEIWKVLGINVRSNSFVGKTYKDEIKYLKSWISDRLTWMDKAIKSL